MKKIIRTAISVFLALSLVVGTTAVCFAQPVGCKCENAPVVFVNGIGGNLYKINDDGSREQAFIMDTGFMVGEICKIVAFIPLALIFGDWGVFGDALAVGAGRLFEDIRCDEQGNSVYNIVPADSDSVSVSKHISGDNCFDFNYDWRLDPLENARELDKYIDLVRNATGHDKVVLEAYSEGGEVSLAYIAEFGSAKIEKYIPVCSAFQGLTLLGRVFTQDVELDGRQLCSFLTTILSGAAGADESVITLIKLLRYTGVYNILCNILGDFIDACFTEFYDDFARPYFGCMLGVFGFVPPEYYEASVARCFGTSAKYSVIREKAERYHNIQLNAKQILTAAVNSGMQLAIVSNYDCYPMPFVGDDIYQSDSLIDSAKSSGGATFAPMGKTFGDGYTQRINDGHSHLSPDGKVDASTCMFPEYTWFVAGYTHWNSPDDLIEWLAEYDGQPTVFASADYPQFLVGNTDTKTVSPQK